MLRLREDYAVTLTKHCLQCFYIRKNKSSIKKKLKAMFHLRLYMEPSIYCGCSVCSIIHCMKLSCVFDLSFPTIPQFDMLYKSSGPVIFDFILLIYFSWSDVLLRSCSIHYLWFVNIVFLLPGHADCHFVRTLFPISERVNFTTLQWNCQSYWLLWIWKKTH
jgi:hypothetical protein